MRKFTSLLFVVCANILSCGNHPNDSMLQQGRVVKEDSTTGSISFSKNISIDSYGKEQVLEEDTTLLEKRVRKVAINPSEHSSAFSKGDKVLISKSKDKKYKCQFSSKREFMGREYKFKTDDFIFSVYLKDTIFVGRKSDPVTVSATLQDAIDVLEGYGIEVDIAEK